MNKKAFYQESAILFCNLPKSSFSILRDSFARNAIELVMKQKNFAAC